MALSALHRFYELPKEIRLEIWYLSLPRPRRVALQSEPPEYLSWAQEYVLKTASNMELHLKSDEPVLLNVNQEARAVASRHYSFRPGYLGDPQIDVDNSNYIDLKCDTLCIGLWDLHVILSDGEVHAGLKQYSKTCREDIAHIYNLAITPDDHFWDSVEEYLDLLMLILPQIASLRELTVQLSLLPVFEDKYWFDEFKRKIDAEKDKAQRGLHGKFFTQLGIRIVNQDWHDRFIHTYTSLNI